MSDLIDLQFRMADHLRSQRPGPLMDADDGIAAKLPEWAWSLDEPLDEVIAALELLAGDGRITAKAMTCLQDLRAKATPKKGNIDPAAKVISWLPKGWNTHHDRLLKGAVAAAKLPPLTFHALRHIYASSLAQAGVPLPVIGTLLGHRSLRVTMRYARHGPEDATKRAVALLQSWRSGKPPEQVREGDQSAA